MGDRERDQTIRIQAETISALNQTVMTLNQTIGGLREEIAELGRKLDTALRQLHGKKTERGARPAKMPSVAKELGTTPSAEASAAVRDERREALELGAVDAGEVEHPVPDEAKVCDACGEHADFRPVGAGKQSKLYDYVPGYFRRSRHIVHTEACRCGTSIVSAEGPERATPGSKYGPGLAAWLVLQKCLSSMPQHRTEKELRSFGIPLSRSTMNDLFHRTANKLEPIYEALVEQVRSAPVVLADETPIKLMSHDAKAYIWTFLGDGAVVYRFAEGRGSETPITVLGGTSGVLLTDDYAGYKPLTKKSERTLAGCLAHVRRKFHEALPTAPEAQRALDLILDVYRVEAEVKAAGIVGGAEHLRLRRTRAGVALGHLKKWMRVAATSTPPKSPLGTAIAHAMSRWRSLVRFLRDPAIPVDNNASERALRVVALGRKNFYGAGSKDGGHSLAILYSLVATCEAQGVEPFPYLRDVIMRIERETAEVLTPRAWARSA